MSHTYTHTSPIRPNPIQNLNHMPPLRHRAFKTGVEGIAGEESDQPRQASIRISTAVIIDNGLKAGNPTDRLGGTFSTVPSS